MTYHDVSDKRVVKATTSCFCIKTPLVLMCVFVIAMTLSSLVFAQADDGPVKTLEDYINSAEPESDSLPTPVQMNSDEASIMDRLQDAILSVGAQSPAEKEEADALPDIQTRYDVELNGFGSSANSKSRISVDVDNVGLVGKSEAELVEEIRREAFDAAITGLFPMRPDQIRGLLKVYDETQRATQEPVHGVPEAIINVATLALDPGVPPMVLKTAVGYVTTINILDITGAPWPVQDVTWAGDFEVTEPEEGGHVIRIIPMKQAAYGNMSIRLLTLKTPISIMLQTGTDEVQYRVDARIPEYGPFAQAPLIEGGMERVAGNAAITAILDGVAPNNATKLKVSGVDGRTTAYNMNGMVYVRTPLSLLSPGWEQSVSSADGMNVYALTETPVLLLSDRGEFLRANLASSEGL